MECEIDYFTSSGTVCITAYYPTRLHAVVSTCVFDHPPVFSSVGSFISTKSVCTSDEFQLSIRRFEPTFEVIEDGGNINIS